RRAIRFGCRSSAGTWRLGGLAAHLVSPANRPRDAACSPRPNRFGHRSPTGPLRLCVSAAKLPEALADLLLDLRQTVAGVLADQVVRVRLDVDGERLADVEFGVDERDPVLARGHLDGVRRRVAHRRAVDIDLARWLRAEADRSHAAFDLGGLVRRL